MNSTVHQLGKGKFLLACLSNLGSLLGWQCLLLLALISRAQADTFDQSVFSSPLSLSFQMTSLEMQGGNTMLVPGPPPEASQPISVIVTATTTPSLVPLLFDWKQWSHPYTFNQAICKERSGDLICLSSEMAQRMRWTTPSLAAPSLRDL